MSEKLQEATIKALQGKLLENEDQKLEDITLNELIKIGMEDSWGFHNTFSKETQNNFIEFVNNDYYSFTNPNLINNLNSDLNNISAQKLVDMVNYFDNLAFLFADNPTARKYHLKSIKYWQDIKFIPKKGASIARYNGSVIDENTVHFLIDDGLHTTNVKVDTVYKTYKFIGSFY